MLDIVNLIIIVFAILVTIFNVYMIHRRKRLQAPLNSSYPQRYNCLVDIYTKDGYRITAGPYSHEAASHMINSIMNGEVTEAWVRKVEKG